MELLESIPKKKKKKVLKQLDPVFGGISHFADYLERKLQE